MRAETLAAWIENAVVDRYDSYRKEVYIASNGNAQLVLTCQRVEYPHGLHPHSIVVWTEDGKSHLLHQDIVDEKYGQIKHSTGNLEGDHGPSENLETIWRALYYKDIFTKLQARFEELHPYNYVIVKGDWEGGVTIKCHPCCPFPGEKYGLVKCSLKELWEKAEQCKSGDEINDLVNSYPSEEGEVIWEKDE